MHIEHVVDLITSEICLPICHSGNSSNKVQSVHCLMSIFIGFLCTVLVILSYKLHAVDVFRSLACGCHDKDSFPILIYEVYTVKHTLFYFQFMLYNILFFFSL